MSRALTIAVVVLAALVVGVPALATSASACGFNEEFVDTGTVHVYMECTQPKVDVDPEEDPHLP